MSSFYFLLRAALFRISAIARILALRCAYAKTLLDVRQRDKGRKVRVLFPVTEIAKWKLQSVYDYMVSSGRFEPIVAVTMGDVSWRLTTLEQDEKLCAIRSFFEERGMPTVMAFDLRTRRAIAFKELVPDVVFYNQPWDYDLTQMPAAVSIYALTCYVPYFVLNYGDADIDVKQEFHQELWRHFLLTEAWAKTYRKCIHFWTHAGRLLGCGHPQLDYYQLHKNDFKDENIVIYAPHWSITVPSVQSLTSYSTFLTNAQTILLYAKQHPEFNWVFKPHPNLRQILRESGAWSESEIEAYWSEWEKIGQGCYTCDYPSLFVKSKALITDCGSFLPEYFATGKPLIHLISPHRKIEPMPAAKMYFDTFYQVHDESELMDTLQRVLKANDDFRKEERLAMLEKVGLRKNFAAEKIVRFLEKELRIA